MQRNELTFPKDTFLGRINDQSWEELSSLWTIRRYPMRHVIISAEDRDSDDVFFVIDGQIRATVYTDAGREVSFLSFSNGNSIGEFSALGEAPRSSDAIAEKDSLVARLPADQFRRLVKTNLDISHALLMLMISHLRRLSKRVVDFNAKTADERLRDEILNLALSRANGADEVVIERPPTQFELGGWYFHHAKAWHAKWDVCEKQVSPCASNAACTSPAFANSRPTSKIQHPEFCKMNSTP